MVITLDALKIPAGDRRRHYVMVVIDAAGRVTVRVDGKKAEG
jgi:hypothetical protein